MPARKKKPFRTLPPLPYSPKNFTIEEARRAVREVMARHGYDPVEMERWAEASGREEDGEDAAE